MKQLIIAAILVLAIVAFAVQNAAETLIHFMFWEFSMSLALLLVITMLLGILLGILFTTPKMMKYKKEISRLNKQVPNKTI